MEIKDIKASVKTNSTNEIIYFPNRMKIEKCLEEIILITNDIDLQDRSFNLENFKEVKDIERKLTNISVLTDQIRLALSIKVINPSKNIDEFIVIPKSISF